MNGECLANQRMLEVAVHHLRHTAIAFQHQQRWNLFYHVPHACERAVNKLLETNIVNALRFLQQLQITLGIVRVEAAYFSEGVFNGCAIVKLTAIGKVESVERIERNKLEMIFELLVK